MPTEAENLPATHSAQADAPGCGENVPAAHGVGSPMPSHAEPAGHSTHVVRSALELPPSVYEPSGQTEQLGAALSLYRWLAPHARQPSACAPDHVPGKHGEHDSAPTSANVPAAHGVAVLEPSQANPAGQGSQLARVAAVPPAVSEPAGQRLQLLAPLRLN